MFTIDLDCLRQAIKYCSSFCEKQSAFSLFDVTFFFTMEECLFLLEGPSGSASNLIKIENPENKSIIIRTSLGVINKIASSSKADKLSFVPRDQGVVEIEEMITKKDEGEKKKKIKSEGSLSKFNIYSKNTYFDALPSKEQEDFFSRYAIYFGKDRITDYLSYLSTLKKQNAGLEENLIEISKTKDFVSLLKQVSYAASTENDKDFNQIFFQWNNKKLTAYASNRVRIAIARMDTQNSSNANLKFACDRKSINNLIKSTQAFSEEPLSCHFLSNTRLFFFFGDKVVVEIGYAINRGIGSFKFLECINDSVIISCGTQSIKQTLQTMKNFSTELHHSVQLGLEEYSIKDQEGTSPKKVNMKIFFQEPNQGIIESNLEVKVLNFNNLNTQVNVRYLTDALSTIDTKDCYVIINPNYSYLFLIPSDIDLFNIEEGENYKDKVIDNYTSINFIMCIR